MLIVLVLDTLSTRRIGSSAQGNDVCFHSPNFLGIELSYEACCLGIHEESDCFHLLGGWYNHEFCCYPPEPDGCDWDALASIVNWSGAAGEQGEALRLFPVVLREFCCLFPGSSGADHPCWGVLGGAVADDVELPAAFTQCCFPVLRRRLRQNATDTAWLTQELDREFGRLGGRRWYLSELDSFESGLHVLGKAGNTPCRLRVRNGGREVTLCDMAVSCAGDSATSSTNDNITNWRYKRGVAPASAA